MIQTRRMFLGTVLATVVVRPALGDEPPRLLKASKAMKRLWPEPAPETEVYGFDGFVPGPVLRVKLGEEVRLRFANELDGPASIHWRGVRLPNSMDGAAPLTQAPVARGETFDIAFTPPDAGTFLYHSGLRAQALDQTARGLSGLLIVEEKEPPKADHEIACLLADWSAPEGMAPMVSVNGEREPAPIELRPGSRVRLRLANGSARRLMAVGFEGTRPQVAAIDGQPCDLFEPVRQTVPATPGGRFDVFFDMPSEADGHVSLILRGMTGSTAGPQTLLRFVTKGEARPALPPVAALPANPLLPESIALEKAKRADLTIEGGPAPQGPAKPWSLNGQASEALPAKPLFSIKRGTPVSLGFVNKSAIAQLMHVHGHVMRQLHLLDDGWEPYWRDSVMVPDGHTVRVAFVADNLGKWLIESGFGTASGPATWFEVT